MARGRKTMNMLNKLMEDITGKKTQQQQKKKEKKPTLSRSVLIGQGAMVLNKKRGDID